MFLIERDCFPPKEDPFCSFFLCFPLFLFSLFLASPFFTVSFFVSLWSAPFSLRPLVDRKKDGSAPCTAAIVAGFKNLPSWRPLAYQNSLSPSCAQVVDSSDLLGVLWAKETTHIKQASSPVFPQKMGNVQRWCVKKSSIDLGTPPWALAFLAVSAHVPLSQPKVRLEQCSLRQRMLLEKNVQSAQCQTFGLETTPRLAGRLRCVQAKVAP